MTRQVAARLAMLLLAGLLASGCDKCGNRLKLNTPTLPAACGANADPAK